MHEQEVSVLDMCLDTSVRGQPLGASSDLDLRFKIYLVLDQSLYERAFRSQGSVPSSL